MSIQFRCPHCGIVAGVATEFTGQVVTCGRCGRPIEVEDLGGVSWFIWKWQELQSETLRISHPRRLVGADQLAATLHRLSGDDIRVLENDRPGMSLREKPIQLTYEDLLTPTADPGVFFVGEYPEIWFPDKDSDRYDEKLHVNHLRPNIPDADEILFVDEMPHDPYRQDPEIYAIDPDLMVIEDEPEVRFIDDDPDVLFIDDEPVAPPIHNPPPPPPWHTHRRSRWV